MNKEKELNRIVQKFMDRKSNREELEDTIAIFKDPYHNLQLHPILFEKWNSKPQIAPEDFTTENLSGILDCIHHRINLDREVKTKRGNNKLFLNISKVAAVLIIGFLIGTLVHYFNKKDPVYFTVISPKSSVSQMLMPDNTMVYLNAGSKIKYTMDAIDGKREVFLEGEAWFYVARNEKKPFIVHTPSYDVNVLGTQFNVKAYTTDNEIVTTLEEGSIQITSSTNIKLKNAKTLSPGEQLIYNSLKKTIEIKDVNAKLFTSWKDNKLIFINMNLKELIQLLERKYGIDIEVTDNTILSYHYDGIIKNETILEVLDLLKETLPIQYKLEGQTILIIKKNKGANV